MRFLPAIETERHFVQKGWHRFKCLPRHHRLEGTAESSELVNQVLVVRIDNPLTRRVEPEPGRVPPVRRIPRRHWPRD